MTKVNAKTPDELTPGQFAKYKSRQKADSKPVPRDVDALSPNSSITGKKRASGAQKTSTAFSKQKRESDAPSPADRYEGALRRSGNGDPKPKRFRGAAAKKVEKSYDELKNTTEQRVRTEGDRFKASHASRRAHANSAAASSASTAIAAEANRLAEKAKAEEKNEDSQLWGLAGVVNAVTKATVGSRATDWFGASSDDTAREAETRRKQADEVRAKAEAEAENGRLLSKISVSKQQEADKLKVEEAKDRETYENDVVNNVVVQSVAAARGDDEAAEIDKVVTEQIETTSDIKIANADAEYNKDAKKVQLTRAFRSDAADSVMALVRDGQLDRHGFFTGDPKELAKSTDGYKGATIIAVMAHEAEHAVDDKKGKLQVASDKAQEILDEAREKASKPGTTAQQAESITKAGLVAAMKEHFVPERAGWRMQGDIQHLWGKTNNASKHADGSDLTDAELDENIVDGMTGRELKHGALANKTLGGTRQVSEVELAASIFGLDMEASDWSGRRWPGRRWPAIAWSDLSMAAGSDWSGRRWPGRRWP